MTPRAQAILARFPAHLEATRPGKLLGEATSAIALDLDTLAAALAAVRRAHRVADADELADLWRIAALHGLGVAEFEIVLGRFRRAHELLRALEAAGDDDAREAAAQAATALWALQAVPPRLPLFADPAAPADSARAAARLATQLHGTLRHDALCGAVRTRIGAASAIHASGNGTVMALLRGAANALDLELGEVQHSADRYWHVARVQDRLRLNRLVPATTGEAEQALPVAEELLGIEENPLWRAETDNAPRVHGELFNEVRRGFERALLQIRITGEGERSVGPMLVNRDEGHGVGFSGAVPNGGLLVFNEEGRVLLGAADVTSQAFAWKGACFAGDSHGEGDVFYSHAHAHGPHRNHRCPRSPPVRADLRWRWNDRQSRSRRAAPEARGARWACVCVTSVHPHAAQSYARCRGGAETTRAIRRLTPRTAHFSRNKSNAT